MKNSKQFFVAFVGHVLITGKPECKTVIKVNPSMLVPERIYSFMIGEKSATIKKHPNGTISLREGFYKPETQVPANSVFIDTVPAEDVINNIHAAKKAAEDMLVVNARKELLRRQETSESIASLGKLRHLTGIGKIRSQVSR